MNANFGEPVQEELSELLDYREANEWHNILNTPIRHVISVCGCV